jgi:V8-like Glu-specific endopeptidase
MVNILEGSRSGAPRYAFLTLPFFTMACGSGHDGSFEGTGQEQTDIISGTSVASGTATAMGEVEIGGSGHSSCSGTLIRNDLVVTARHCVTSDGTSNGPLVGNPANFTLSMDAQSINASEIIDPSGGQYDFAYLVPSPFFQTGPSSNNAQGWFRSVYPEQNGSLVGQTLTCLGYGDNTCSGGGFGVLRSANLTVSSASSTELTLDPNSSGQSVWHGDSGGTCFTNDGSMIGVTVRGYSPGLSGSVSCPGDQTILLGPQVLAPAVNSFLNAAPGGSLVISQSQNVNGDGMQIGVGPSGPSVGVWVTPNWNPPGRASRYWNHNIGVWFSEQKWLIFDQDLATMATGVAFNVAVGTLNSTTNLLAKGNVSGDSLPTSVTNGGAIVIATPVWNPPPATSGVYNDRPTGVWFNGNQWEVYNEDGSPMPAGAAFFIHVCDQHDGAFVHFASSSNTVSNWTYLTNPNIDGQPNAKVLVTHSWNPGGQSGTFNNHPIGVWFDASVGQWAIFNEDLAPMPTTIAFNVWVAP